MSENDETHKALLLAHELVNTTITLESNLDSALELLHSDLHEKDLLAVLTQLSKHISASREVAAVQSLLARNVYHSAELDSTSPDREEASCSLDLGNTLIEVARGYHSLAEEKGIELVLEGAGNYELPEVSIKRSLLLLVLQNVVNNAIKYSFQSTKQSRRTVEIRVHYPHDPKHKKLAIAVLNYGVGVLPEEMSSIGSRGYRGALARKERSGLGLGLFVCKRILQRRNGALQIQSSRVNKDAYLTEVKIILPYR